MTSKTLAIFLTCALASVAANSATPPKLDESLLRAAFVNLKDPDSAKFKNIVYGEPIRGIWTMCGEVNAKNSYGGYIGFSRFSATVAPDNKKKPFYLGVLNGEAAEMTCKQHGL